jgi:hypothetical protein
MAGVIAVTVAAVSGAAVWLARDARHPLVLGVHPRGVARFAVRTVLTGTVRREGGASPVRAAVDEVLSCRVLSVGSGGVAAVEVTVRDIRVDGRPIPAGVAPAPRTIRVAPNGSVLSGLPPSTFLGGTRGAGFPGLDQVLPLLIGRPVGPGDRWTRRSTESIPGTDGPVRYAATARLVGYGRVGSVPVAAVTSRLSVPVDTTVTIGTPGPRSSSPPGTVPPPTVAYRGSLALIQAALLDRRDGVLERGRTSGMVDMAIGFSGFPSLFPTFGPVPAPGSVPFGGGPGPTSGAEQQEHLVARVLMTLRRLP